MSNILDNIFKRYKDDLGEQITIRVLKENLEFYDLLIILRKMGKLKH